MAFSVTATVQTNFTYAAVGDDTIASPTETKSTKQAATQGYTAGTGAEAINQYYRERLTITAASGTIDLDLTALTNRLNDVTGFSEVKEVFIQSLNEDDGGTGFKVGGAGTNAWTGPFAGSTTAQSAIGPKGKWNPSSPVEGWAVSGTNKLLRIEHDGGSSEDLEVDVYIIGNS